MHKKLILLFCLAVFFSGCQTTKNFQQTQNSGFLINSPSHSDVKIVKVDLTNPNLKIVTNPKSKKMFFPKAFAKSSGSEIVINTTPFKKDGSLTGLAIDNKKIISNPVETYCALCFFKKTDGWKAEIIDAQSEIDDLEKKYGTLPDIAAGGFWTILRNQEIYSFKDIKNYRTAAGICDNGKTLILLSAKNMSYMDCARIFLDEGAEAAMQFDGGRSAQLVINGKNQVRAFGRRKVPAVLGFIQ